MTNATRIAVLALTLKTLAIAGHVQTAHAQAAAEPKALQETPSIEAGQEWLINVITGFTAQHLNATNDMAKGLVRRNRAKALCAANSPLQTSRLQVNGWLGTITELSSVDDGRGILAVAISPTITLTTARGELSEEAGPGKTLLIPDAPLYNVAVQLSRGQRIRFSGTLFPSSDDCIEELSFTPKGGMERPEFLFRFTDITPIDDLAISERGEETSSPEAMSCEDWGVIAGKFAEAREYGTTQKNLRQGVTEATSMPDGLPREYLNANLALIDEVYTTWRNVSPGAVAGIITSVCRDQQQRKVLK